MANTTTSSMITSANPSISQNEMREVADQIRYLGFGEASMSGLIKKTIVDSKTGQFKEGPGLISKRPVKNIRYEQFNRSPRPYKFTVTAGTEAESSGVTFSSVTGIQPGMMIYNPKNKTGFRAEVITTLNVKGTSVGPTTFSCAADDVLVVGAAAIKAGSAVPIIVNGTDDHDFNTLQFARLGVSIDWVMESIKEMAGGKRFTREKMYLIHEFLRDMDHSMILGQCSGSVTSVPKNTTTGTQTGYVDEFPTTKGLINLAANSYDMLGSITLDKIRRKLPLAMGDTINDNQELVALLGNDLFGRVQELIEANHYNTEKEGVIGENGIKCYDLLTAGPKLKLVKYNLFNVTGLDNTMLIFDPANVGYVHLEGYDIKPNNGIQDNDVHGKIDELVAYFGIETKDAGKSATFVTNCF